MAREKSKNILNFAIGARLSLAVVKDTEELKPIWGEQGRAPSDEQLWVTAVGMDVPVNEGPPVYRRLFKPRKTSGADGYRN